MPSFEEVMSLAVQLPVQERERLARALGVAVQPASAPSRAVLPMAPPDLSKTNPAAWRQKERGHAVLATDAPAANLAPGPASLRALWEPVESPLVAREDQVQGQVPGLSRLRPGSPVLVHTGLALALAYGEPGVLEFWERPPVEIRLSTATYLKLLELANDADEQARIRAFIQPYAVLSLGPMASSRAVDLLLASGGSSLKALDGLIAATAIAHEIPLLVLDPSPFVGLPGLGVVVLD